MMRDDNNCCMENGAWRDSKTRMFVKIGEVDGTAQVLRQGGHRRGAIPHLS